MTGIEAEAAPLLVVDVATVQAEVGPALALEAARRAAELELDPATETGRVSIPQPGGWMRLLAASLPGLGCAGYKEFHLSGDGAVRYAVYVFDLIDGRPLGVVDGALLTPLRTAAGAAALAVHHLGGRSGSLRVGVIGSSTEAQAGLRALAQALPVGSAAVTSRRVENRERFAQVMGDELGVPVEAVAGTAEAGEGADVVYIGTASGGRVVVDDAGLGGAPLVLSIGSTIPAQREVHHDVLLAAGQVVVDTVDVLDESGDARAAVAAGLDRTAVVPLGRYLTGSPADGPGRTIYKSIGSPVQDVVLAAAVLAAARERGFGRLIDPLTSVKRNLTEGP